MARGYLGGPDRTAMRFLPNPYSSEPGARMYRTGDYGRWDAERRLEVLGRIDRQLKVSGYRVDPAEAERALTGHHGIADAAVTARELSPGDRQLIAYLVRREPAAAEAWTPGGLRDFLADRLPSFMIPAVFVEVTAIPRLARRRARRGSAAQPAAHRAPRARAAEPGAGRDGPSVVPDAGGPGDRAGGRFLRPGR